LAKNDLYWRSSQIYWRKSIFIGEVHKFIGENQNLLANWKFPSIFSSSDTNKADTLKLTRVSALQNDSEEALG
jgi:hypothetical protein